MQFGTARKPAARNSVLAPAVELGRHLVPPDGVARPALDDAHVVEAEGQQHGLLQPLMHLPLAAGLLGHAGLAGIEEVQRLLHGLAHGSRGGGVHIGPVFPGGVDGLGEVGVGHGQLGTRVSLRLISNGVPGCHLRDWPANSLCMSLSPWPRAERRSWRAFRTSCAAGSRPRGCPRRDSRVRRRPARRGRASSPSRADGREAR